MIDCCNGCVPPKRTPTCKFDGTCNRYAEARAKYDEEKAVRDQQKAVHIGLVSQNIRGLEKFKKAQRKLKRR